MAGRKQRPVPNNKTVPGIGIGSGSYSTKKELVPDMSVLKDAHVPFIHFIMAYS
jgi:hypothetical protein